MKKIIITVAVFAGLVVAGADLSAKEKSIAGTWTFLAQDMSLRLELKQRGTEISGSLETPHGPLQISGAVDGDVVKFKGAADQYNPISISAAGVVKPDGSLAGTLTSNVGDMTWMAVRRRK
jgi:hypothetical protein